MLPDLSYTVQVLFFDLPSVHSDPDGDPSAGPNEWVDCVVRLLPLPTASGESTSGRKAGEWLFPTTTIAAGLGGGCAQPVLPRRFGAFE